MKAILLMSGFIISIFSLIQNQKPLTHGMVYGTKPNIVGMMSASQLEAFMGKKTRISTTIRGKVLKVTKQKGGWFDIDAGNGKIIAAHFGTYDVSIPMNLKGHTVITEGIAQKQFIADDLQHLAGDTVSGKKQHGQKVNPKQKVTFEVMGLMVEK
jgi:Domain of unknown function (DUF4920)